MRDQLEYEGSEESVRVQPSMGGYCLNIEETDIYYKVTHSEVQGDAFNIGRILGLMRHARDVNAGERSGIFRDTTLNRHQAMMTFTTRLMVSSVRKRKQGTEGAYSLEKMSMRIKDQSRKVPEPLVVLATIDGHEVHTLIDSGSMADFVSTMVVEQLKLRKETYAKPLSVQLAVHGSQSKINCGTKVNFKYQDIDCERRFDITNLDNYDVILGTLFLFQHKIAIGINPPCVVIGSKEPVVTNTHFAGQNTSSNK